jgi:hypothetical protein
VSGRESAQRGECAEKAGLLMKAKTLPPIEYLRECFVLGGITGLIWIPRPVHHFMNAGVQKSINSQYAGKPAGRTSTCGRNDHSYWVTHVGGFGTFLNHRLVISLALGTVIAEDAQVDHVDHNGMNNDPNNLRVVSHAENQRHRKGAQKNNGNGSRGVTWAHHDSWGSYGAWRAYIHVGGRSVHLGYFADKNEAIAARKRAEQQHWEAS